MNRPKILLTNDDGIASPGLLAAEALSSLGGVIPPPGLAEKADFRRYL